MIEVKNTSWWLHESYEIHHLQILFHFPGSSKTKPDKTEPFSAHLSNLKELQNCNLLCKIICTGLWIIVKQDRYTCKIKESKDKTIFQYCRAYYPFLLFCFNFWPFLFVTKPLWPLWTLTAALRKRLWRLRRVQLLDWTSERTRRFISEGCLLLETTGTDKLNII